MDAVHPKAEETLARLRALADPAAVAGMARYGINPEGALGLSVPAVRQIARELGRDHALAEALWASGVHEARWLASMIDDPRQVTEEQMERWVLDLDSWDVCDGLCGNLFDRTPFAYAKAFEWSRRLEEYVKRAGFVLMASLAVHDKQAPDEQFLPFLAPIAAEAGDGRNFVKKAVNWALRQIGKRSRRLNELAVSTAQEIARQDSKTARWVANDALRELTGEKVQSRLK